MKKKLSFMIVSGLVAIAFIITPWVYKQKYKKKEVCSNNIELGKEIPSKKNSSEKNVETTPNISKDNNIINEGDKNSSIKNNTITPSNNDVKKETTDLINSKSTIKNNKLSKKAIDSTKTNSINKSKLSNKKTTIVNTKKTSNTKKIKAISKVKIAKNNSKSVAKVTNNIKRNTTVTQPKINCPKKTNIATKPVSNCNNKNNLINHSTGVNTKNNNIIVKQPKNIKNDESKKSNNIVTPLVNNTKNNDLKDYNNSKKNESIIQQQPNNTKNKDNKDNKEVSLDEIQQAIFKIVNRERVKHGKSPLSYDKTMEKYAIMKSKDMITRNYFDHVNPEGKLITEKINADGVKYMAWGENIIYRKGQINVNELAEHFMNKWMNSPGHRANILSDKFKTIGVGLYRIGDAVYGTQEFCKY